MMTKRERGKRETTVSGAHVKGFPQPACGRRLRVVSASKGCKYEIGQLEEICVG
jgi:hypothetical protein